ncbi:hypothetical protein ACKI1S_42630 [Streptomyces galilaeus]|uniref:Uncharacterized protein n=1 Tax=Streptomyces galilaeus TaxID=33899 RepID=A0ABW9IYQ1_STRGJ
MNIATGSVLNMAPAGHDWVVAFDHGDETAPETVCPVIGWATVVEARLNDGTATTCVQPAFLYLDMVWTPNELREHDDEITGFEVRARAEANVQAPEVRVFHRTVGWTIGQLTPEPCTSNHFRQQDGRPACAKTAVWKVVEDHGMHLSIGFYCDDDLPDEHRHPAARA